ncbi:exodeoxyribonuclease V subunit beta [Thauera sp.]|uniref:exodeoxyribonuclease V subunit beta n=1 Tax=Thauera sp. TaxID=1905334 RepID=UPI002C7605EF|nr:exodeoxyribonuclease V subunit beta [Thauera sp.]HRO36954.1 exodeoxyribonuclease V subunit beta [Thauera sp.]
MSHRLDPVRFPLRGSRLIEASAGTGKTWTIAALYLRLVLGHGDADTAFERPLLPAEILVMTFTRAATRELSERIRERLREAAAWFRDEEVGREPDPLLDALLAAYPDPAARRNAAWRLAMAAEAMDDAAVFTIDAWCQRMLREHAFDSGNPFDEELAADESVLLTEAAQDYWRQHCYPLAGEALELALAQWADVHALVADVRELVGQPLQGAERDDSAGQAGEEDPAARPEARRDPAGGESLAALIERVGGAHRRALIELTRGWAGRARAMKDWLDEELAANARQWNRTRLHERYYTSWLETLEQWARNPLERKLELSDSARHRLTPDGLHEARKADAPAPALPEHFAAFARLIADHDALRDPRSALRVHAATRVGERLAALKRQARSFGFADMLERLDRALAGPHGARLRERILAQYPVALIDEFQDTSPLQYRLFDALYHAADDDPRSALLLIGDPKQSIYGFRGADIYSYLQARRATAGRHYMLGTNFRSARALVSAVNTWFAQAEDRPGAGAFGFRDAADNALPFEPVAAKGRDEVFQADGGVAPALLIHHDLALRGTGEVRRLFAARCAERIVAWLNDERAGFQAPGKDFQRLRPADIAVLVRTGREAAEVRRALRRRGVASVYLSDKDSVFASDEARDLLHWLRAAASPLDARLVRAALATRTVGLSIAELAWLASSDEAFDARSEQFRALHTAWRELGVLTMLRRSLHLLDLPARWLAEPAGERRLTNFLHLAELLQQASAALEGEAALVRWLAMAIEAGGSGAGEEQVVRLESDADLVKVVTVHKSKGLEYPLVCLPFATSFRAVERRTARYLKLADADGRRQLKLDYDDADLQRAEAERLREDLRLFYVALTRARHALWMGFAAMKIGNGKACQTHRSAPGQLLAGGAALDETAWLAPLQALAAAAAEEADADGDSRTCIALEAAMAEEAHTLLRRREALPPLHDSPPYRADFERRWSLGSFSALVRDLDPTPILVPPGNVEAGRPEAIEADPIRPAHIRRPAVDEALAGPAGGHAAPAPTVALDRHGTPGSADAATAAAPPPWHRFPRGAFAGDFLHDLLEWLAAEGFALAGSEGMEAALRRRCERAGHGERADELVEWMRALLAARLPSLGAALQDLRVLITEMEFWLPSAHLQAQAVDALCQRRLLNGQPRPALPQRELHGMLMGFADLVFEHEGRYWVLDYKSNSLGEDGAAYDHAALEAAMAHHRYDVQAAIYLLALHRLLRARLGAAYEPARQLGGALYFFLRGIDGPARGEYAIPATPALLELLDTLDHLLADEASLA